MNLAWIAASRLAVAVTERTDRDQALSTYERVTLRSAAAAQRRARFNMLMGARMSSGATAARDLAIRALAHGPAGDRLVGAMTMRGL
jgi:2-polyprenyl-6-methoxyphenol hydroxylase-like FAD-dependent oxidoreductase